MRTVVLVRRNLAHYWRTNLAVVFGVAIAVAVLAGALLVGDSVRASLRDLVLQRLGKTDHVITSTDFFHEQLASEIANEKQFASAGFGAACPLIAIEGNVAHESNKRRATAVRVYGVDERFWQFHAQPTAGPQNREVLVSDALARELESRDGDSLLIRIKKPSAIPVESLHGRKEDLGETLRLTIRQVLLAAKLGEFSLQPQQGPVRAVFVPLKLLQRSLGVENRVNAILISEAGEPNASQPTARVAALNQILKSTATLDDYGIKLRGVESQQVISLERSSTLIDDSLADKARAVSGEFSLQIFSYLANRITLDGKSIPYSLVTAVDEKTFAELRRGEKETPGRRDPPTVVANTTVAASPRPRVSESFLPPIILNEWAARDLGAAPGNKVSLEYYFWHEDGRLETKTADFYLAAVTPVSGIAADRDLVPDYPGISESASLADWDPPFPVNLKLIRKQDEDYWKQYRTTPKAFIQLSKGQELWQTRFGKLTSIRFRAGFGVPPSGGRNPEPPKGGTPNSLAAFRSALQSALDPGQMGLNVNAVRDQGLQAARGATDFGEYFLYFSFFLVISALLLAVLFFKLGIEQRLREIGTLQAIGFSAAKIRRMFLAEGLALSIVGSVLGLFGSVAYGYLIIFGLRTWWVDAVGTTLLKIHVSPISLSLGGAGGVVAALASIVWTLRRLGKESTRGLLSGTGVWGERTRHGDAGTRRRGDTGLASPLLRVSPSPRPVIAIVLTVLAFATLLAALLHLIGQVAGFFGGGGLLLVALLFYQSSWLRQSRKNSIRGNGWTAVSRLGFRNSTHRPSRSVLCITLIALSTFIIVAVDAFRRTDRGLSQDKKSGSGGFPLMAESLLPLVHNLNTQDGREALNIADSASSFALANVTVTRFRLRPGDDASCLNLYAPANPRVLGVPDQFIDSDRFAFQSSLAGTSEENANPWLLLNREFDQGAVPVIADANSLAYVLHKKIGDDLLLTSNQGTVRVRFVGALSDSVFQSELVMSDKNFIRLFPEQQGSRFFLIDAPELEVPAVTATLEDRLSDYGFDVTSTAERLANFHRVENTYLSTFQLLGGLGLALGTLGIASVLLRNVFERRKELALLRAVGYNSSHFATMVFAENALLLFLGLVTGTFCALLAIAPVFFERGGRLPNISLGILLLAVLLSGLTASLVATWAALRSPLLQALRAE
jgi:ABC-type antimicrobial peptide transport system permease subunit